MGGSRQPRGSESSCPNLLDHIVILFGPINLGRASLALIHVELLDTLGKFLGEIFLTCFTYRFTLRTTTTCSLDGARNKYQISIDIRSG